MRKALVLCVVFAVVTSATAAEKPIPQDTAKIEKRRRDRLEWNRRTLQGAYDKIGKKERRWDESARKTMDLSARMFSQSVDPAITHREINVPAKAAVDAGCDDPLLVYLYNRTLTGPDQPSAEEMIRRMKDTAKALAASRYPAFRRAVALRYAGNYLLSVKDPGEAVKKDAERHFDEALTLLGESVKNDERNEFWEDTWHDVLRDLIQGYRTLGLAPNAAFQRVDAGLARYPEVKVLRLLVRGNFWYFYGWEARGESDAANVPAGGFEKFGKRLEVAQEAYIEAWQTRPGVGRAARQLVEIDKAIGGDRDAMEHWFERAMKSNGDDREACYSKLDWLDPKWHGNPEAMLEFGHACRDSKNWQAGITLLAAEPHIRNNYLLAPREQAQYMKAPDVWADIQPVYEEYLKHFPDNNVARSKYAYLCYISSHFKEAQAQFDKLGDRLSMWTEWPWFKIESLKEMKTHTAKIVSGTAQGNAPAPGATAWVKFGARNPDGAWTVAVPAKPERTQETGILGARARNVSSCTADGITYTIRIQPLPPAARSGKAKIILDTARSELAEERGGKARDEHDVKIADNPAQEFLIDSPTLRPKIVRVRVGIIGDRLYELSVVASETDVKGAAATRFFDSFRFE